MAKKLPKITKKLENAVENYLAARAEVERIKPIVDGYRAECLSRHPMRYADEFRELDPTLPQYITDIADDWMADTDEFTRYCLMLEGYKVAYGFGGTPEGYCPLKVAEGKVLGCSRAVLDAGSYLLPGTPSAHDWACAGLKLYNDALDLLIKAVISMKPRLDKYNYAGGFSTWKMGVM
jgi:hypothetical protein